MRALPPLLAALLIAITAAAAGPPAPPVPAAAPDESPRALERQIFRAFERGEHARAAELIEAYLKTSPNDAAMLYNGACACSLMGERERAASFLFRAVEAGFNDFDLLRRDPDLAAMRDHVMYQAILEAAARNEEATAAHALRQWRATYGTENYRYEEDEERRLHYATALDPVSHREMRRMLERQADQMIATLFGAAPSYYVLVAVPTPGDGARIFDGDDSIGGIYEHPRRRLVARDIGTALRHEFFHVFHYGHMAAVGQTHPIWIQEGMACLYEDYQWNADGTIRFLPNQRHNVVRNLARSRRLMGWARLFSLPKEAFMDRAGPLYPQVRSIFEYLADQGKLAEWYKAYVSTFTDDPAGAAAFRRVFGRPLEETEEDWQRWVASRPALDVEIDDGDAALGIESDPRSSNDGVEVLRVIAGSAAARAGVKAGDVIVAVDGRPVRSLMELRVVIGSKEVGEAVKVRLRRGGAYHALTLRLRPIPARLVH